MCLVFRRPLRGIAGALLSCAPVALVQDIVTLIPILILSPLIIGAALFGIRAERPRKFLVVLASLGISLASLGLLVWTDHGGAKEPHWINMAFTVLEILMTGYLVYVGLKARRPLIVALVLVQAAILLGFEGVYGEKLQAGQNLFVDQFAVVLALINGVIGSGICLYALGYMRHYHEKAHPEILDRQPFFFSLLFLFMGSMFGIIFSNNLVWLFAFWEITTVCSYLLIGYSGTKEARRNALHALTLNLVGGLAFALAIVWAYRQTGSIELQKLITNHRSVALLPAALLCFAGLTKSAQLPFSSWLLGAMVAPTPVSALLHSSTMVKAGVYLVLRMAPVVTGTKAGLLVALVGGVTFLAGSLAAMTASDAKKVLAHSTIANLGLIVLCGGIGTAAAVWAGILLIIFHALAKCLLFLCVGLVEHRIHSRDIEAMSGLILNFPRVAIMMLIGMAGMFLAPFGMLISKWAVLKAVVDACAPLSVFIIFGSAATLFFWVKWMGKLLEVVRPHEPVSEALPLGESVVLHGLAAGTFLACLFFPLLSSRLIEPFVSSVYGVTTSMSSGNIIIMTIMMVMVLLFPLSFLNYGRGVRVTDAYLGGANLKSSVRFVGSAQAPQEVSLNNYYLRGIISEAWISKWGSITASVLLSLMVALSVAPS